MYSDAVKRKCKEARAKPKKSTKAELVTNESNKLLMKRFVEDFSFILKKKKIKKEKLGYQKTESILKELGFLTKQYQAGTNEENVLFVDLWG